jgi:hypothetical protein
MRLTPPTTLRGGWQPKAVCETTLSFAEPKHYIPGFHAASGPNIVPILVLGVLGGRKAGLECVLSLPSSAWDNVCR